MTAVAEEPDGSEPELLLLVDPAFEETAETPDPPPESVIGAWPLAPDGTTGRFRPNPVHVPSSPDVPSDPVDAVLRLLVGGEADEEDLLAVLGEVDLDVALDPDEVVLILPAPDGQLCLLATTAPRHRAAVIDGTAAPVASWRTVGLAEVAAALPEQGVDVLLNPHGPAPMRVAAAAVRDAAGRRSAGAQRT
jgi:hypothetical protein